MNKALLAVLFGGLVFQATAMASPGEDLFKSKPCVGCHTVDSKLVGPALKEVGAKYAAQKDGVDQIVKSITTGSKGKWGQMQMPPNNVTPDEAKALAEWIVTLK